MVAKQEPKSLAAYQALADHGRGIACPSCGAKHIADAKPFGVVRTNPQGQQESIRRIRVCRNCGRQFITAERVIGRPE